MHFYFIGVTTNESAMARILPLWSKALDLNLELVGIDLPIEATPAQYRDAISDMKSDPKALGAVVTTHKQKVYEHAADLFDEFDAMAKLTHEVSSIAQTGTSIAGLTMPQCMSSTLALNTMLDVDYWKTRQSDALFLGAGGAARAIVLCLLFDCESDKTLTKRRPYTPKQITLVDTHQEQLDSVASLLEPLRGNVGIKYVLHASAADNDRLLASVPKGSLIVNATGMGKDRPGSPITDAAKFPEASVVWELNYRGERSFLKQAKSQEERQSLQIHDGWIFFLHGWTQALEPVLQRKFSPGEFDRLAEIAEPFRVG